MSDKVNWNNKKILVVDDEEVNYILINEILLNTSLTIEWVKDGKSAVEMCCRNGGFNLILMDYNMPKMNGDEATKLIKQQRNIPIIMQTCYTDSETKNKCAEAGSNDFLEKPIRKKILLNTIKKYL